jgi:hypothetical protein
MLNADQKAELLETLWEESTRLLLKKVKEGTATPSDIANALKTCKENGITIYAKSGDPITTPEDDMEFEDFMKDYTGKSLYPS